MESIDHNYIYTVYTMQFKTFQIINLKVLLPFVNQQILLTQ